MSIYENDDDEDDYDGEDDEEAFYSNRNSRNNRKTVPTSAASPYFPINNLNYTLDCECGCLLNNLVPGFNYSLIVTLSPSESYCEDEDEAEHHNLKWILHVSIK